MKKFSFRLEKVLKYRRLIKDDRLRELLEANAALDEAARVLAALDEEACKSRIGEGQYLTVDDLIGLDLYNRRLAAAIDRQRERIAECREVARVALEHYMVAAKEEKALSMLKDRRRIVYMEQVERELQNVLDEAATQRAPHAAREDQVE